MKKPTYKQLIDLLNELVVLDQVAVSNECFNRDAKTIADKASKYLEAYAIAQNDPEQREVTSITLTCQQILDLAKCASVVPGHTVIEDNEEDSEYTIVRVEGDIGITDDDGTIRFYKHGAYITEYPDEGTFGLGPETKPPVPKE